MSSRMVRLSDDLNVRTYVTLGHQSVFLRTDSLIMEKNQSCNSNESHSTAAA